MDLYSPQNRILLKNCIVVKLKQLNIKLNHLENHSASSSEIEDMENTISYYSNLYEILKADDVEVLNATIHDSMQKEKFMDFSERIVKESPKDIAQEYIDLTKSLMEENEVYSLGKFEELKRAFFKGNEDLLKTTSYHSLEEEPSSVENVAPNYLTEEMQNSFHDLQELLEQNRNSNAITPFGFKNFSARLKEITKDLAKYKLEQAYEKKIEDNSLKIQYDDTAVRPTYQILLALTDHPNQLERLEVPALTSNFIATPFQNLCYTYLQAQKYSSIDEEFLDSSIIAEKMSAFRNSCNLLTQTMSNYCFTISNGHIFTKAHASYIPTREEPDIACDSPEHNEKEREREIL